CIVVIVSVVFFFQAEDGIRDDLVTGVQTCALPILRDSTRAPAEDLLASAERPSPRAWHPAGAAAVLERRPWLHPEGPQTSVVQRSEERRVGEGGRFGWGVEW